MSDYRYLGVTTLSIDKEQDKDCYFYQLINPKQDESVVKHYLLSHYSLRPRSFADVR